ncbi:MAG: hypothetical protein ACYTG6_10270 [Planctomycetota bacterium]
MSSYRGTLLRWLPAAALAVVVVLLVAPPPWGDGGDGESEVWAAFAFDRTPEHVRTVAETLVRHQRREEIQRLQQEDPARLDASLAQWRTQAERLIAETEMDVVFRRDGSYVLESRLGESRSRASGTWTLEGEELVVTATHTNGVPRSEPQVSRLPWNGETIQFDWLGVDLVLRRRR